MVLLLVALLLLPTAMLPREEFYPVEKVEVEARDAGFPEDARRAVVVTRTGGVSPVKVLNVKVYEKEGEYGIAHVEYIVVYHTRDYVMAKRTVDFQAFERLWFELGRDNAMFLNNAPEGSKEQPTYMVRIHEVKNDHSFTVTGPETQADPNYGAAIKAVEQFWKESLAIQ